MKSLVVAVVLWLCGAVGAVAQSEESRQAERTTPVSGPTRGHLLQIQHSLDRLEGAMSTQAAATRRDAFIVTRLVTAVGALNDFQANSAIQAAIDEVEKAQAKALENPRSGPATVEMLATIHALLVKARGQGSMANLPDVQREILVRLEPLQRSMFAQVDELRRSRLIIADIRTRLTRWDDSIDEAMVEALTASLDYTRKGGK